MPLLDATDHVGSHAEVILSVGCYLVQAYLLSYDYEEKINLLSLFGQAILSLPTAIHVSSILRHIQQRSFKSKLNLL